MVTASAGSGLFVPLESCGEPLCLTLLRPLTFLLHNHGNKYDTIFATIKLTVRADWGVLMRIVTDELLEKIQNDQVYKLLTGASRCEDARLVKESEIFEKWIAGVHRRERAAIRRERLSCN